jgi:hypothetical protein
MDEPAPAPTEPAAPIDTPSTEPSTPAPEPTANLLGSVDDGGGIQPDTSNEPWFNQLDEEYRTNPNVTKYDSMNEMAKGLINQSALIGKKGIIRPGEDATPEEMGEYFNSIGRPAESSGYKYEPIEGAPEVDSDAMASFTEFAHQKGFTQEQYQSVIELDLQRQQESQVLFEQEKVDEIAQTRMAIYDELGEAEGNALIQDADSAAVSLGLIDVLRDAGVINNLGLIKALANARKDLGSSSMVGGEQISTESFETQVAAIRANPAFKDHTHPDFKGLEAKMDSLFKVRFPGK